MNPIAEIVPKNTTMHGFPRSIARLQRFFLPRCVKTEPMFSLTESPGVAGAKEGIRMIELLADFTVGIVMSSGGAGAGWLLHRALRGTPAELPEEQKIARAVLERLKDLASNMAADVGQHSSRVEEINQELTDLERPARGARAPRA